MKEINKSYYPSWADSPGHHVPNDPDCFGAPIITPDEDCVGRGCGEDGGMCSEIGQSFGEGSSTGYSLSNGVGYGFPQIP